MKTLYKTALTVTLLILSPVLFANDVYETIEVNKGDNLYIDTDVGSINIETHNRDTVIVEVSVSGDKADEFSVSIDKRRDTVEIKGEKERSFGWNWGNLRVKFDIIVPEEFNVDIKTSGGSITVNDLIGDVDANTSGGSIRVSDIEGEVDLDTSGGSIESKDVFGDIDAHTSGGSIDVSFSKQFSQDASFSTSGGSIYAALPDDISIDVDASTSGGRVKSEFNVSGRVKKQSIRGEINGGGPELKLKTSGGSIRIVER